MNKKFIERLDMYPDMHSIKTLCNKKLPNFVWDYFDSSTGKELVKIRNTKDLSNVLLKTKILEGNLNPNISAELLGNKYEFPLGVAPVGMSGLCFPNSEIFLAKEAISKNFPYVLSTVSACSIERLAENVNIDNRIWFQLYCPKSKIVLEDLIKRAIINGIKTLVITIDLPGPSVRERQIKSGLSIPPKLSKKIIFDCISKPFWSINRLVNGFPRLENLQEYESDSSAKKSTEHVGYELRTNPDIDYLRNVRQLWPGDIIIKGLTSLEQLEKLEKEEFQGVWISNHSGRQFDAHPSTISILPSIRDNTDMPILIDGGFNSGLDILKGYALGANFVMSGTGWHYALGAFGKTGPRHLYEIIKRDIEANMIQMGLNSLEKINKDYVI
jgi:L-lactate dehydrogenase (cytochrome)